METTQTSAFSSHIFSDSHIDIDAEGGRRAAMTRQKNSIARKLGDLHWIRAFEFGSHRLMARLQLDAILL